MGVGAGSSAAVVFLTVAGGIISHIFLCARSTLRLRILLHPSIFFVLRAGGNALFQLRDVRRRQVDDAERMIEEELSVMRRTLIGGEQQQQQQHEQQQHEPEAIAAAPTAQLSRPPLSPRPLPPPVTKRFSDGCCQTDTQGLSKEAAAAAAAAAAADEQKEFGDMAAAMQHIMQQRHALQVKELGWWRWWWWWWWQPVSCDCDDVCCRRWAEV